DFIALVPELFQQFPPPLQLLRVPLWRESRRLPDFADKLTDLGVGSVRHRFDSFNVNYHVTADAMAVRSKSLSDVIITLAVRSFLCPAGGCGCAWCRCRGAGAEMPKTCGPEGGHGGLPLQLSGNGSRPRA
ncbi:MAG: hypothetical protein MUC60_10490, partial [Oscillatoria sp. Prado101]|nr:hypothetical protein [Oscillatoria sp. Prado101]